MNSFQVAYKQLLFIAFVGLIHPMLKAQNVIPVDSLSNFIQGSWELSGDTNVLWVFKDNHTSYQYYLNSSEKADIYSYKIIDTCIVYSKGEKSKKVKCLSLTNEKEKDKDFFHIIILNNYSMYLRDIPAGRSYDFTKQLKGVIYR